MLLPLAVSALAAPPRFTGDPLDIPVAEAAWRAAEACTGRVPVVGAEASIVRDLPATNGAGLVGLASWPAGAPGRIRLAQRATQTTIAHEVAHAWVNQGPRALVEGRTEALTACMQRERPDLFAQLMDRYSELESLPDLRAWDAAVGSTADIDATLDAYLGSFRLFRAVGAIVPPQRLWADDLRTWEGLEGLLAEAGPNGATLTTILRGGADAQRAALVDGDGDGLSVLYERFTGTDPTRYDSDGDGWWDGSTPTGVIGAVPFPRSRQPVCLTHLPTDVSAMVIEMGGQLGGMEIPASIRADGEPGTLVRWDSGWQRYPGGVWARAADASVVNARCGMRAGVTVRAKDDVPDGTLDALAGAVDAALVTLTTVTDLPRPPVIVSVEGEAMYIQRTGEHVRVPLAVVRALGNGGGSDVLARQVAALATVERVTAIHRTAVAAALVRAVFPGTATTLLDVPHYDVPPWSRAAVRCSAGWTALLDGKCASPAGGP